MPVIQGIVEIITFRNEENFYTVAKVQRDGKDHLTAVVGNFASISIGETLRLTGEWTNHSSYGRQFKVEEYQSITPATLNGIERYLGSGMLKGIGPVMARRLVKTFGLDTLTILAKEPERLLEIEGIGKKKLKIICKSFEEHREVQRVMVFLQGLGITPAYAVKIYRQYGEEAIDVVKENPYRLAQDIFGIGFTIADKIAMNVGIEKDSHARLVSGILYVLSESSGEGHVYLSRDELIDKSSEMLEVSPDLLEEALKHLITTKHVFVDRDADEGEPIYLAPFYFAERGLSLKLARLMTAKFEGTDVSPEALLSHVLKNTKMTLAPEQIEACRKAITCGAMVLTGGPGTGKTTTINTIIRMFDACKLKVRLAAPTGRAAKRMGEATRRQAMTIHRMLEFGYTEGEGLEFGRTEDDPLDADVVIIDESSMIDLLLMYNLVKAIKPGTRLILVGDVDQLPSVGPGCVLKDIINSQTVEVVQLTKIFRQAQQSMIVVNAHRINKGMFPVISNEGKDFFFMQQDEPEEVANTVVNLISKRLPEFTKMESIDMQVITPMKKTVTGVENLNGVLQNVLNPFHADKEQVKYGSTTFRLGDKVMQIKNNYTKKVFNGDIGIVSEIDREEQEIRISYPQPNGNLLIPYDFHELDELVLSYAISVHKSQGSEYPVVIMPITTQHFIMLQRNLVYTAITRAKKMVVLVGTKKALAIAVKNNKVEKRNTGLSRRLQKIYLLLEKGKEVDFDEFEREEGYMSKRLFPVEDRG